MPDGVVTQRKVPLAGPPVALQSLPSGRTLLKSASGDLSTELSITVRDPRINGGKITNIPTIFGGKFLTPDQAIERIVATGGVDPDTGRALPSFKSMKEAVTAAKRRSKELGKILQGLGVQ